MTTKFDKETRNAKYLAWLEGRDGASIPNTFNARKIFMRKWIRTKTINEGKELFRQGIEIMFNQMGTMFIEAEFRRTMEEFIHEKNKKRFA